MSDNQHLTELLTEIRSCRHCEQDLPLGPRPVLSAHPRARLLIIGQAPGTKVHASGIPWDDPSGDRLRNWLGVDKQQFYDASKIAIMPMGFCYPGKGKSGDLPPSPACAPKWHQALVSAMPKIQFTLLVGAYAHAEYLGASKESLTQRVKRWRDFGPDYLPTPHPSPRNTLWLKRNPWFEQEVVPHMRERVAQLIG